MMVTALASANVFPPDSVRDWRAYWHSYTSAFVDPQGRVIDAHQGGISTSEGQAYALFFSLVANQPQLFARILAWTNDNLAGGRLGQKLPGWLWGKNPLGRWTLLSPHSASDADLWLAYTLIEAGSLWHRSDYTSLGLQLADTIAREEVVPISFSTRINEQSMDLSSTPMLLPGYFGFVDGPQRYVFNPSYLPLPLLLGLAQADPRGPWQEMASQLPNFLRLVSPHGFAPDWVGIGADGDLFTPPQGSDGSYNAIRVYLWAGMGSDEEPLGREVLHAVYGMRSYLQHAVLPPTVVDSKTGTAHGQGPAGFSAALLPYLAANHDEKALVQQLHRVRADYDAQQGLLGQPAYYYDQNLALFAFGYRTGSFHFSSHGALQTWWSAQAVGTHERTRWGGATHGGQ
ncbi:cellulose synthase complex periplasmic endoglucanase BcsZ [Acidithiobacillus sp. IBUN Pt1247-S3]